MDQINWSPGHRTPSCDHAQIVNDYDTGMLTDQRRSTISKLYLVSLTARLTVWARISLELLFHEDKNLEPEIMLCRLRSEFQVTERSNISVFGLKPTVLLCFYKGRCVCHHSEQMHD